MLAGGVEAARQPVRISPQTLGNQENADQCASPNTRQKNFRRRPQGAPCLVRGLDSEGEELPRENAMLLSWSGFCGRVLLAPLGRAECSQGSLHPGPRRIGSLRAPAHLGESEEPDGGPPGPATLTHLRGWDGAAGGRADVGWSETGERGPRCWLFPTQNA